MSIAIEQPILETFGPRQDSPASAYDRKGSVAAVTTVADVVEETAAATEAKQAAAEAAPLAGRREWVGLAVLTLACLLYSMDLTVLHLAVPSLSAALRPGSAELLWIIDVYGFLVAGSLITMGTLGDRIGRRKLLLGGAAV